MVATDFVDGQPVRDLGWMLASFANRTLGVREAVAVSGDGFLLAASAGLDGPGVEQFGAIISGLTSLSRGAADLYGYGEVNQVIIEMMEGYLFVMAVDEASTIGVLADVDCDVGSVGYEMTLLIQRVGELLTPALIAELKNVLSLRSRAV